MQQIGILYICTGQYKIFWKDFYLSSEKYLLNELDENGNKKFEKKYFVWTDAKEIFGEKENKTIKKIFQKNLGWPYNTLMRFDMFLKEKVELEKTNFLFFFNSNCVIEEKISEQEFLPSENNGEHLIATLHPGYFAKSRDTFPYDKNPYSLACIHKNEGEIYFAGGLNGGVSNHFLEAIKKMNENIKTDLKNNVIALWHDESHWNRYLIERKDVKVLSPAYLYPEDWILPFEKKILIRNKSKYINVKKNKNIKLSSFPILRTRIKSVLIQLGIKKLLSKKLLN